MAGGSFWARFKQIDDEADSDALLQFLDDYARVDAVQDHKRRATDALALQPGDRVLDLGCGTGVDLEAMLERVRPGGTVLGVDISRQAADAANRRLAGIEGASAVVSDAEDLGLPDASFDACRADRTLQHVRAPERALAELRRVLRPGGRLVILEVASSVESPGAGEEDEAMRALRDRVAAESERHAWLPLMLPVLLPRAGFADVSMDVVETTTTDRDAVEAMLAIREAQYRVAAPDEPRSPAAIRDAAGGMVLRLRGVRLTASAR